MIDQEKIEAILLRENYVTSEDMKRADEFAKTHHVNPIDYLLTEGLITKDLLGQAIAESLGIPYADLHFHQPSRELVLKIPEQFALQHGVVLFQDTKEGVVVAASKPEEPDLLNQLHDVLKFSFPGEDKKIMLAYALPEYVEEMLIYYRKPLETRFGKIIESKKKVASEIIEEILEDAISYRASDIHFEPQEKEVVIRFRVDGVLHEAGRISREYYDGILNRIKVQARLRIDTHFATQDGAVRYERKEGSVDLRISIVPTLDGEKVAIRILAEYIRGFSLGDLGLFPEDQALIAQALRKPFGMILASGPTGSGKTTTLYALLKLLNRPEVNITTIEDPVEYKVIGVNQIQVNPQTNLTFAEGLRSIVRQDPNIILVGEIRDRETAEISVNAALTGHLLLSTLHANDAATAIPRLLDIGVEPFLLASTLNLIVSQRLARRICESCRQSLSSPLSEMQKIIPRAERYFNQETVTIYRGKGCNVCGGTGYRGRVGIFEIIEMTPELQELILTHPSAKAVGDLARMQGSRSLFDDGILKVKSGITSIEELLRVAIPRE